MSPEKKSLHELLDTPEPAHLGRQGRGGTLTVAEVRSRVTALLNGSGCPSTEQQLILSLILLWHDHLEESHAISQGIENADGSFVHAIMHRREPDAWNSKYWWRRVGEHPAFKDIAGRVTEYLKRNHEQTSLRLRLVPNEAWSPTAFVDACDKAKDETEVGVLREIQRIEFEVLLDWLVRKCS